MCFCVVFIALWKLTSCGGGGRDSRAKEVKEEANQDNELTFFSPKEKQEQRPATFNVSVSFIFTVIWQAASGWLRQQI